jgi:hypothetical protein
MPNAETIHEGLQLGFVLLVPRMAGAKPKVNQPINSTAVEFFI